MHKFITTLSLSLVCATASFAGTITQALDNTSLTDTASWSALGSSSSSSPVSGTIMSANGVSVTPTPPSMGNLYRLDQNNGWGGGFTSGDQLLYNGAAFDEAHGDITIAFGQLVSGAGLLFQNNDLGDTDTVHISAFDSLNNLLGTVTTAYNGNNTPVFIGLTDDTQEIASIAVGSGQGDFVVDTLNLADTSAAPEPASLLLSGLALLGLGATYRRRRI